MADPKATEIHPLFEQMERLSDELCQTQAFILRALQRAGLTVVTEADRKVLEAMAGIEIEVLEHIRDKRSCAPPIFHPPCLAELEARKTRAR